MTHCVHSPAGAHQVESLIDSPAVGWGVHIEARAASAGGTEGVGGTVGARSGSGTVGACSSDSAERRAHSATGASKVTTTADSRLSAVAFRKFKG